MNAITMSPEAMEWHRDGERGISSEAIFDRLTFGETSQRWGSGNHPHDPSDFRRCELLLRRVPEFRERLPEMAQVSPVWAALVERWDEIAAVFEEECPGVFGEYIGQSRMATRTYDLMKSIIWPLEGFGHLLPDTGHEIGHSEARNTLTTHDMR